MENDAMQPIPKKSFSLLMDDEEPEEMEEEMEDDSMEYSTQEPVMMDTVTESGVMTAWQYAGYLLLFQIPLIGFIMMLVYAFSKTNLQRRNLARGYLILAMVGFILMLIILMVYGAMIFSMIRAMRLGS